MELSPSPVNHAEKGTESHTALTAWLSSARRGEKGTTYMPNLKLQQMRAARLRAERIREIATAFRRELSIQRVAGIKSNSAAKVGVRLFVVQLPTRKSDCKEAA